MMGSEVICEGAVHGACHLAQSCPHLHYTMPYLWQINMSGEWRNLDSENEAIESEYSRPERTSLSLELTAASNVDGRPVKVPARVDFTTMQVLLSPGNLPQCQAPVRRLSTPSYCQLHTAHTAGRGQHPYATQWRWYWLDCSTWRPFGETAQSPSQSVLEAKFLHGQPVYRFEVTRDERSEEGPSEDHTLLLRFPDRTMISLNTGMELSITRRPLYISRQDMLLGKCLPYPPVKQSALVLHCTPEDWAPVDDHADYELVPLSPGSAAEHRVAQTVADSLPRASILDVFRLQNAFLWVKYSMKKEKMAERGSCNEKQLFHGTSEPSAVKAICQQNLDWRLNGKNGTKYGQGAYFAAKASFSDKYTRSQLGRRWMFLVRVLVGASAVGRSEYTRPPPVDPGRPHEELYDSCVDSLHQPSIYVVFDSDQYYPEYAICYKGSP